jgi:PAS domain S-box-containing protein
MSGVAEPLIQASLLGEAIDHGPVAVFVADDDLRYIAVNEFACSLLGYTREELLGMSAAEVMRDVGSEQADFVGHGTRDGTSHLVAKNGSETAIAYRTSETTVAGMRFYVVIAWPTG